MSKWDVETVRRINHINYVVGELHDLVDEIYESFVDEDYQELRASVMKLNRRLNDLADSTEDEIQQ
tara:strand:+ start:2055 stop:2252 length:198 start_codon:yes stop_codon:yes gene_type:complete